MEDQSACAESANYPEYTIFASETNSYMQETPYQQEPISPTLSEIPVFHALKESKNILLAGAGGGFDIFSGIPLYFNLKKQGKNVVLANFSFTALYATSSEKVHPFCYKITAGDIDLTQRDYFPEKFLQLWLQMQGIEAEMYAFEETGVNPLRNSYDYLIRKYEIDTVILIDGGTDSLMFGDEEGLGTPHEDICSMAAVYKTGIKRQYLINVGFGVDHFHHVSHFRFLENVAELSREGGYLGLFQPISEMEESRKYIDAVGFVNQCMQGMESIVSNSIVSALKGEYGNYHTISRTQGSELWINPLMTIHWCFDLRKVIPKIKYYDWIKDTTTFRELHEELSGYRNQLERFRDNKRIPI